MMKKMLACVLLACMLMTTVLSAAALSPEDEEEMAQTSHSIPLFGCNTEMGGFVLDQKDYKAGTSALSYTLGTVKGENGEDIVNSGQASFAFKFEDTIGEESIDASDMDTLEFWLYVSDREALGAIQFADNSLELTSGGTFDVEETHWQMSELLAQCTQNGWNEIRLSLNLNKDSTATDWTRLNFMRWFFIGAKNLPQTPIVIKIDNIRLTDYTAQETNKATPLVAQMAEKIQKGLQDIPEWDAESADILAQYQTNYSAWSDTHKALEKEIRSWNAIAQVLMNEHESSVILNRVRRYLRRYEEYLEEHPELAPEPDDTLTIGALPTEPGDDAKYHADLKMMGILIVLGALAVIADIGVYRILRKKKNTATNV